MFIKESRTHTVIIPACDMSMNIRQSIINRLYKDVEGITLNDSYIVSVLNILFISEGILTNNGDISFKVKYQALSIQIINDSVIEARVIEVNSMGMFAQIGPVNLFVSHHQIPLNVKENIMVSSLVRLRVKGVRYSNGLSVVGSLNEEYLGVVL